MSVPVTAPVSFESVSVATRFVMFAEAPDSANLIGTVEPSLKTELPSASIGCSMPLHATTTVIRNDALPWLPWASVATHVTVVVPSANSELEAGEHVAASGPSIASTAHAAG